MSNIGINLVCGWISFGMFYFVSVIILITIIISKNHERQYKMFSCIIMSFGLMAIVFFNSAGVFNSKYIDKVLDIKSQVIAKSDKVSFDVAHGFIGGE